MASQWSPFSQQLLAESAENNLTSLLPASRRTREDDLEAPAFDLVPDDADIEAAPDRIAAVHDWIDEETDLTRLTAIHNWLWIVGRPMPPRPLHQQQHLLNRQIVITEKLDLHLVWTTDRIFIKPLPRFILDPRFWAVFLECHTVPILHQDTCSCGGRRERALGFLFSYTALIAYESDFHIAKEAHLIPLEVQWPAWRRAVQELLGTSPTGIYPWIDPRFYYGELRLSRLNKIYFFWKSPLRGYISRWNQYGSFFHDNFATLASSTIYIAVVLTAMQVGLATNALQGNVTFQLASYGFTVFSIVGPLAAAGVVVAVFCYFFIGNWVTTRRYNKERLERIKGR